MIYRSRDLQDPSEAEVNTLLYDLSKIVIKNPESNTNGDRTDVIMPDKNDDFIV